MDVSNKIEDKIIIITGGAGGIGSSIADNFLSRGAKVTVLFDINEQKGIDLRNKLNAKYGEGKAMFIKCDVTLDLEDFPKLILKKYGRVDVMISCCAILDEGNRIKAIDVNLGWMIDWCLKFWEYAKYNAGGNGGTIVIVSSAHAFKVDPFLPTFQAANFGVLGFAKCLGHKYYYENTGVRVMTLCVGWTKTGIGLDPETMPGQKMQNDFLEYLKTQTWQDADAVGKAAVEVFEHAESGTAWLIEGGRPIEEIL